jgi:hypothetical protein
MPFDAAPVFVIRDRHPALDAHADALVGFGFAGEQLLEQAHWRLLAGMKCCCYLRRTKSSQGSFDCVTCPLVIGEGRDEVGLSAI